MDIRDQLEDLLTHGQRYKAFLPTAYDTKGLGCEDQQAWIVSPVSITRNTYKGDYPYSNYRVFEAWLDEIDPDGEGHEVHRFNHWGPGWFEIILINPDHLGCMLALNQVTHALDEYPVLDDCDHSEREREAHADQECGEYCSHCEFERAELIPLLQELEDDLQPVDRIYDPEVASHFQEALNVAARFIDQATRYGYRPELDGVPYDLLKA